MFKKWKNKKTWNWFESCFLPRSKWGKKKQKKNRTGQVAWGRSAETSRSPLCRSSSFVNDSVDLDYGKRETAYSILFPIPSSPARFLIWWCLSPVSPWLSATKQKNWWPLWRGSRWKFKFIYSHLFNCNTTTIRKKKEVKTELTIHWIKRNKGKKCVAGKGAKLSSWLLPQSGYKWVEVI